MSKSSSLKERFARLGPTQAIGRVQSGSRVDAVIKPASELARVHTVYAIHALIKRYVPTKTAMRAVENMVEFGETALEVPMADETLAADLLAAGVAMVILAPLPRADVRAIRERLGLSAAAFAKRYALNPRTVEGWEQGRPIEDAANAYLHTIAADPRSLGRALDRYATAVPATSAAPASAPVPVTT
jgi:putative transcriptional regulator